MPRTVCLIPGDGIGPEVLEEALKVLGRIESRFGHEFQYETEIIGGEERQESRHVTSASRAENGMSTPLPELNRLSRRTSN